MRKTTCSAAPLLLGLLALGWAPTSAARAEEPRLEIGLQIYDALFAGPAQLKDGPTLLVDLEKRGDHWERVWGIARNFNVAYHPGRVVAATLTDQALDVTLEMNISGDWWVDGGRAKYILNLKKNAAGTFEGTYTGAFRGIEIAGRAEAQVKPPRQQFKGGAAPAQPGEHPRILFRASDLPRLREKAQTPFGQAALARMGSEDGAGDVIGMGVKYQLTGEAKFAAQAVPFVQKLMDEGLFCDQFAHNVGNRMERVAITYDLCYAAWTAEFRRKVESYLAATTRVIFYEQRRLAAGINWHVCSNWSAPLWSGAGFAGLALWGEKGPAPAPPVAPTLTGEVPAAKDYTPPPGVPVCDLAPGRLPAKWLATRPQPVYFEGDPFEKFGGLGAVRPEPGMRFEMAGREAVFQPLAPEFIGEVGGFNLANLLRDDITTTVLYTVINNTEPRWVRVRLPFGRSSRPLVLLNGVPLADKQVVKLEKGLYPLLAMLRLQVRWLAWDFAFNDAQDARLGEAKAQGTAAQAEYEPQRKDWQADVDEWQRDGGLNTAYVKLFQMSRRMMYLHYREAVGTGGFQAECGHYSHIATGSCALYAMVYRQMWGEDVSPYGDITHYVPRKMFAGLYRPDGPPLVQGINGTPEVSGTDFAALFPIVPDEWKPAVLWAWNYHTGVKDRDSITKVLEASGSHGYSTPVYAFLNYPLDATPKHPSLVMPLTWQAPDFGYYGFRNSWVGQDDFIAQVFLKAHYIGGWNCSNAGTFRLLGLGQEWNEAGTNRDRCRWEESVVMLPDNPEINAGETGQLAFFGAEKDGSGAVTVNLDDLYATYNLEGKGKAKALHEAYGNIRHPAALKDSGIHGLRAYGVDFSGRCGAPCLFVIVDKITGGKGKVWSWHLASAGKPEPGKEASDLANTKVEGNTFTISKPGGATLRATFAAPSPVALEAQVRLESMLGGAGSGAGQKLERPIAGVFATSAEGGFFVVVTVQRGEPPAVKIAGAGLDAKVTVGGVKVSFDGQKVVIER